MSVTESAVKTPRKANRKQPDAAQRAALDEAVSAAETRLVPLSALRPSPLNVRTLPYSVDSIRGLAESVATTGLLQNLTVHALPDGLYGVAAGGRRLSALQLLREAGRISPDYPVAVKVIPETLATVASVAENEQRAAMHPAEQITGFRTLAEQGQTPEQIGAALGFGVRHVRRMLKLAGLAPSLLALLAENKLTVEQGQALCLESDPVRQMEIYADVTAQWSGAPVHALKRAVTDTEISVTHAAFRFVGRETYEAAGGVVREDLFSAEEGAGTADSGLVFRLFQEKLDGLARDIQQQEGWAWSLGRNDPVWQHGKDRETFLVQEAPAPVYTRHEQGRLDELQARYSTVDTECDEAAELAAEILALEEAGEICAWPEAVKAVSGVVVSMLSDGEIMIQRGIRRRADMTEEENSRPVVSVLSTRQPDAAEGVSVPLLTKMSSERTLAVQAALMQQPEKAVALMTWRLCTSVFGGYVSTPHPFRLSVTVSHGTLTAEAPSGKNGAAYQALMAEKHSLENLLPAGWEKDFTTFFTLDGSVLMALLAFCTACSVDGVQTRDCGHTSRSNLDPLENAIGFHLRDWWQPGAESYFRSLKHSQIVDVLNAAGMTGAARDAEKMKKGEAADLAESVMAGTRWVPAWLCAADPTARPRSTDTDTPAHAA